MQLKQEPAYEEDKTLLEKDCEKSKTNTAELAAANNEDRDRAAENPQIPNEEFAENAPPCFHFSAVVAAGGVAVGDALETDDGAMERVTRVNRRAGRGIYFPQTLHGQIVVDGVVASTYTTVVEPGAAHTWLAPARLVHQIFGIHCSILESVSRRRERWRHPYRLAS